MMGNLSAIAAGPAKEPGRVTHGRKRRVSRAVVGRTHSGVHRIDGSYDNDATRMGLGHVPENYMSEDVVVKACKRVARWMRNHPEQGYADMPQHIYEKACLMNSTMA